MTDQIESYSETQTTVETGLQRESPDPSTQARQHFEQAYVYDAKGDFENALRECDLSIQLAPAWAEPHNLRGLVLDELGRKEEAIAAYRAALRRDPGLDDARTNLDEALAEARREERQKEPALRWTGVYRPGWVVAAVIFILLGAIAGGLWPGIQMLIEMGEIDWVYHAARLNVESGWLQRQFAFEAGVQLATGVLMCVSLVGIWKMRKWGTIVYWVVIAFAIVGLILGMLEPQSAVDTAGIVGLVIYVGIGLGLIKLWRDGELI